MLHRLSGSVLLLGCTVGALAFAPPGNRRGSFTARPAAHCLLKALSSDADNGNADTRDWIELADQGAVRKKILNEGSGNEVPQSGVEVKIDYIGTLLGMDDWTPNDVVECWLSSQQGLDDVADGFIKNGIDGKKLLANDDDDSFVLTEEFITNVLGVSNRIKCKKLIMAAKRLRGVHEEYPIGLEFDSNKERGEPYSFVLGKGKVVRGMDLGVASMKFGERSRIVCRADYAYGAEGYRKRNGDVMVPPFASLCFEVTLLK